MAPRKSSRDTGDADSGVELLSGVVGAVEGVHRALASGVHDMISSGVYDTVRAGIAFGGVVARLAGVSSRVAPVVESGVVQRVVGVANGALVSTRVPVAVWCRRP